MSGVAERSGTAVVPVSTFRIQEGFMNASLSRSMICAFVLAAAAGMAPAQQPAQPAAGADAAPGYRMGPGMMGGPGRGYGMGPGMAGGPGWGYGMGPGMMERGPGRGYGMGPGMMGWHGTSDWVAPGMMGHGMGMMGGGIGRALWALDLNDEQRKQVLALQEELRKKHWDLAGRIQEEQVKLRDAWWLSGKRDRAAILAANKRLGELRQQGLEQSLDVADRLDAILDDQQREQLRRRGPWWLGGDGQ